MFKRGGVYWCKIRHNGRIVQKSLETPDRKLAQAIEAKVRADIAEGKFFEKSIGDQKNFVDLISRFVAEHGPRVSANMRRSYGSSSENLIEFFGQFTLGKISAKDISQYKEKRRKKEVTPATINRELAMLSKAFNMAIREWEWLEENPVSKVPKEREDNQRDRWLTREEEERFLANCPAWLRSIVIFDLNTGMRRNEVLSMECGLGLTFFGKL